MSQLTNLSQAQTQWIHALTIVGIIVIIVVMLAMAGGAIYDRRCAKRPQTEKGFREELRKLNSERGATNALGCLLFIVLAVLCVLYLRSNWVPRTYPTSYNDFLAGVVQGFFLVPTFIVSLFSDTMTIYQSPNNHNWYNFGYVLGAGALFGGGFVGVEINR